MEDKGDWLVLQQPIQNWSVDAVVNPLSVVTIDFILLSLQVGYAKIGQKGDTVGVLRP